MSDRTQGSLTTGGQQEAHNLAELHASKTQESLRHTVTEPSNTDLASASIQSTSVVRLTARPEKRKIVPPHVSTGPDLDLTTEPRQERHSVPTRGQEHGILKNPYFPYQGGPLERLITWLANLVKHLERSLLSSLRPQVPQPQPQKSVMATKKKDASGREIDENEERCEKDQPSLEPVTKESN